MTRHFEQITTAEIITFIDTQVRTRGLTAKTFKPSSKVVMETIGLELKRISGTLVFEMVSAGMVAM